MSQNLIFIVEDDANIREMEVYALESSGFDVVAFDCGKSMDEALKVESKKMPKLIILDIMLPGEDGLGILKRLRAQNFTKNIPVMMLTAKGTELDKVKGLDLGADDYMTKPFGVLEFISRVKALLRRFTAIDKGNAKLQIAGIVLDDDKHIVSVDGVVCDLTFKEYELLKMLMASPGHVFSRNEILERVWGVDLNPRKFFETRTVDVHVKTLRQKLGSAASILQTVRNVGYKVET